MRCLERNQKPVFFALFQGDADLRDADGRLTGEHAITYGNPVQLMANVSPATGASSTYQFGQLSDYDKVIVWDALPKLSEWDALAGKSWDGLDALRWDDVASMLDQAKDIDESTVFWIDTLPDISTDGTTNTPHDYIVKRIAKSLNGISIAVKKVPAGV